MHQLQIRIRLAHDRTSLDGIILKLGPVVDGRARQSGVGFGRPVHSVVMNPFLRAIEVLNRHAVRYVIVGGLAAYLHGTRRVTVDLDIVVDLRPEEARKAR